MAPPAPHPPRPPLARVLLFSCAAFALFHSFHSGGRTITTPTTTPTHSLRPPVPPTRALLFTGWYGRFSNNLIEFAELVALGLLLNRTILLPSSESPSAVSGVHGVRYFGELHDGVLHLPALDALGVHYLLPSEAGGVCPTLNVVRAVVGTLLSTTPYYNALPPGVAAPSPVVVTPPHLRDDALPMPPGEGVPLPPPTSRANAWLSYPYTLLLDPNDAERWISVGDDGMVAPGLVSALRGVDDPCLAVDALFFTLDWRPYPALFRAVFGAVTAPTPSVYAVVREVQLGPLLGGGAYNALHLRQGDYCLGGCSQEYVARILTTVAAMLAAPQCAGGLPQLLLLTDAPTSPVVDQLRAALPPGTALVGVPAAAAAGAAGNPAVAHILVEQGLAVDGVCMMGCGGSTFSALVRVRRELGGRGGETFAPWQYRE